MSGDASVRRARRPDPRLGVALAGAGCGLAVVGVMVVAGDALDGGDGGDGGGSQLPGILLSLGVLVAGLLLLLRAPTGPLRTAGTVASVLAVPATAFFLSFDDGNSFEPFSGDLVVIVSAIVWLAWHFVGPAAGRTFPLAAGLLAAWLAVLQIVQDQLASPIDLLSYGYFLILFGTNDASGFFGPAFGGPDTDGVAMVSLLAGVAAVVVGRRLDRNGEHARATAVAVTAVVTLFVGSVYLIGNADPVGAGLVLAAIGVVLAADGATRQRRGTTWSGAVFVVVGLGYALLDVAGDSATGFGLATAVAGIGTVVAAYFLTAALGEPDELAAGPSTFSGRGVPESATPAPENPWAPPTEPPTD